MKANLRALAAAGVSIGALCAGDSALAQKSGGTLKVYFFDSPASMSIHEEATIAAEGPMMGVFNNLVMYNQDVPQSRLESIVPDLATDWSWDEDKTELTFGCARASSGMTASRSQRGRRVHLGPADRAGRARSCASIPARPGTATSKRSTPNGDNEVTFRLKRPQPAFIALLASGVYAGLSLPCVAARDAPASDRHRPLQIRRVQAERGDQGDEKPGLLEAGPALSRRHRIHDHQEPVDRRSWRLSPARST